MLSRYSLCLSSLSGVLRSLRIKYTPPSSPVRWKSALWVNPCLFSKRNCIRFQHTVATASDEEERNLQDDRTIFVRDFSTQTSDIRGKLLEYFSLFGEVENVRILHSQSGKPRGLAFVSFTSLDNANRALKEKHCLDGRWLTIAPKTHKGAWKGKSSKIKVDNVPQDMSAEEVTDYFSQFGTVEDVDFVILDPLTMKRKSYCFVGFSTMDGAKQATLVEKHMLGTNCLRVYPSKSKLSAVKQTKEIIARSLPSDITVEEIKAYFEQFGALEQIDLIYQAVMHQHKAYAFVRFESPCAAEKAAENLIHSMYDNKLVVQKTALAYAIKNGDTKVFVEGFKQDTDPEGVKSYFAEYGKLNYINEKSIAATGNTHVVYKSSLGVQQVLREKCHVFDGCELRIRAVAWRKPPLIISALNQQLRNHPK